MQTFKVCYPGVIERLAAAKYEFDIVESPLAIFRQHSGARSGNRDNIVKAYGLILLANPAMGVNMASIRLLRDTIRDIKVGERRVRQPYRTLNCKADEHHVARDKKLALKWGFRPGSSRRVRHPPGGDVR